MTLEGRTLFIARGLPGAECCGSKSACADLDSTKAGRVSRTARQSPRAAARC